MQAVYRIEVLPRAHRELAALPKKVQRRLVAAIDRLETSPRPIGAVMLGGSDRIMRLRIAVYRVLFRVDHDTRTVLVLRAGHRREVYRRLPCAAHRKRVH